MSRQKPTTKRIAEALISLLSHKSYLDITVTDVVREAGVARASFYRSFHSVDEVADHIADNTRCYINETLYPALFSNNRESGERVITEFLVMIQNRTIHYIDIRPDNRQVFAAKLNTPKMAFSAEGYSPVEIRYLGPVALWSLVAFANVWVENGFVEEPQDLARYIWEFLRKA